MRSFVLDQPGQHRTARFSLGQLDISNDHVNRVAIETVGGGRGPSATTVRIPTLSKERAAASANAASSSTTKTKIDPPTAAPGSNGECWPRIFVPWSSVAKITQSRINAHRGLAPPSGAKTRTPQGPGAYPAALG
jgi:hypothetical protein